MPSHEGKSNQPFVISREELAKFTILTAEETAKIRASEQEAKKPKDSGRGDYLTLDQAETIMGKENFFGTNEVEKAFGIKIDTKNTPEIPFTEADLERARELGQFLVLRADTAEDGQPLTMVKMNELLQNQFVQGGIGKVLFNTTDAWKLNSEFFTTETPRVGWALVNKDSIPNSTSKNYLQQTQELAKYVTDEVFRDADSVPVEYQEAVDEFESYFANNFQGKTDAEISTLLGGGVWQKYAQELGDLKINQLTRQTPSEVLYDLLMYFNVNGRLLENKYTWTNRRASDGDLVSVGGFVADGAGARLRLGAWPLGFWSRRFFLPQSLIL